MLKSKFFNEQDLKDFGFKSIGKNIKISSDVRIYGQENITIGDNVRIDDFSCLAAVGGQIDIGNQVFIARNSHLSGALGIKIQDFSSMAANVVIYSGIDDFSGKYLTAQAIPKKYTKKSGGKVCIGRHVIIGANTVILGASNVGEGCSIGASSLVKNDLDPWGIYAGIPAKRLKDRKKDLLKLEEVFLKNKS